MQSKATTVEQYLAELPADRREALQAVRATILKHLPKGYESVIKCPAGKPAGQAKAPKRVSKKSPSVRTS